MRDDETMIKIERENRPSGNPMQTRVVGAAAESPRASPGEGRGHGAAPQDRCLNERDTGIILPSAIRSAFVVGEFVGDFRTF